MKDLRSRFGFHTMPFTREIRVSECFTADVFQEAIDGLGHILEERMSGALIGPAGTGKTTILRAIIDKHLPEARYRVHYVKVSGLSKRDMCREIAMAAGCSPAGSYPLLVRNIQERFRNTSDTDGMRSVLIIDDAHDLRPDILGILRVLTNYDMDSRLVLSIILAGQLPLKEILRRDTLDDVARRLAHYATLRSLSRSETGEYIEHRCAIAGASSVPFDEKAIDAIYEIGRGNLRATDHLSRKTLHVAHDKKKDVADNTHVVLARKMLLAMTQDQHANELPTVYARDLDVEQEEQRWLIQELWARHAAGILGGQPKSCKTFLGIDFAVSVASGTPALGHFPVKATGPVLVYLAEDALAHVRARIEGLCQHRCLDINCLDLGIITSPVLRLDTTGDQERLRQTLRRFQPRLLVLDPFVRLHSRDENSSSEISWLLSYFRDLQRTFDLAIILTHHMSKKHRSQPGQALRGSSDFHAWSDSSAYLARRGDLITLTVEHRSAKPPEPMTLALVSRPDGTATHLELRNTDTPEEPKKPSLEQQIIDLLRSQSPLSKTDLRSQLRVNNQHLGTVLKGLEKGGQILRSSQGWCLSGMLACDDLPSRE